MPERYQCKKCGAEMPAKQKVCPRCGGSGTPAGGKFDIEEEHAWRPSPTAIKVAAGVVVVLILALVLYNALHVVPPEQVAEEWFSAMSGRSLGTARELVTPAFQNRLASKMSNLQALSDEYNIETYTNRATYRVGKPVYRDPYHVDISVFLTYPGNTPGPEVKILMIRSGRQWLVDQVL